MMSTLVWPLARPSHCFGCLYSEKVCQRKHIEGASLLNFWLTLYFLDGTLGYIPISSNVNAKKNFLGTLLPSSSSSNSSKPRLAISAPEDFRQVSSIIDVDIVPDTCRRVRLVKHGSDKPLGFYIRDGTSVRVTAHGVEKVSNSRAFFVCFILGSCKFSFPQVPGIFISRLIPGGLAESTGLLAVNDEVLEVNGIEVNGKSLDQVTDMMVANSSNLIITIRPANQRGHSTLSGSFSSNTISTSAPSRADPHGYRHSGHQTNSLERGAHRPKKSMAPPPPVQADFHNPHHPVHYGGASVSGIGTNPGGAFESLHRSAAHRHSASIIPGHHHSASSSQHHFHHEPMSYHQFNSNRHSVIGGPGMAEGVKMNAGPLGNSLHHHQGASVLHHDDSSDDDDEDEVRDHFTTSLVINSPHEPSVYAAAPSGGSVSSLPVKSNGQLHNTTVIINSNPSASTPVANQHIHHHNMTISSATVPVNRTNSNLSNSQGAAAASSAAAFIRNSLRGKNGNLGGGGPSSHVTSKSFSNVPLSSQQQQHQDRSHYAHLFHHSENALLHHQHQQHQQQQQQANRSRSQSSSASSSPTILTKQHVSTNPSVASGSKGAGSSADSDIVTL